MKNLLLLLVFIGILAQAQDKTPKMGCVLSQKGEVSLKWSEYSNKKYAIEGKSKKVEYVANKKEGNVFKEILVGSVIKTDFKDQKIIAKITHIQAKKRVGRGARHGLIEIDITLNNISKKVPFVYFYEAGDMLIKSHINLKDFNLSNKTKYTELSFAIQIYSVVCAI